MPIDSHSTERIDSGSSKTSSESITGGISGTIDYMPEDC